MKLFQYCADSSSTILYFRALQGHSGRNLIDPYLHSIINSGLIPGGQNLSKQTDSILSACGSYGQRT